MNKNILNLHLEIIEIAKRFINISNTGNCPAKGVHSW